MFDLNNSQNYPVSFTSNITSSPEAIEYAYFIFDVMM